VEKGVFPYIEDKLKDFVVVRLMVNIHTDPQSKKWLKMLKDRYKTEAIPQYAIHGPDGKTIEKLETHGLPTQKDFIDFLVKNK
jgi:hypothetical protein